MQWAVDPEVDRAVDAVPNRVNGLGYDPWGFNPQAAKLYFSIARHIYAYFRPEIVGIENLPPGRVLIVPNHSGQLPLDGLVIAVACLLHAQPPRLVRAMAERWFPTLPWVNIAFSRSGVVVGDPINCKNLLEADNAILVFPEGARGCGKTFQHRYQLEEFGRGFMRLALQTGTPIVPVGVVGAEESIISVANLRPLARLVGMPYAPVSPLLPLLGPLAYLPLPTRFHVHFGKPLVFDGPFDDEDTEIDRKVAVVKDAVAGLLRKGRAQRRGWFT
ncbi:MAG: acyltransferase family protein [Deltaproteobacteria bacterium]|nr:acyltransferase family protein [Deltaproteobacteria bacterium]